MVGPLFEIGPSGRLAYAPFARFELPRLYFEKSREERGDSEWADSRLWWSGTVQGGIDDSIPAELVDHWELKPSGKPRDGRWALSDLVEAGLPAEVPEPLAYHLAVNHGRYNTLRPLAGLTTERVKFVLDHGLFKLDGRYRAAADYLRFVAQGHWQHPLLTGFDTLVNDRLLELCAESTRLYFFTLGDRLHDDEARLEWAELATYFFWVGRTGSGSYVQMSRLEPKRLDDEARARLADWQAGGSRTRKAVFSAATVRRG